jgi:hypothetical protein
VRASGFELSIRGGVRTNSLRKPPKSAAERSL